MVDLGYMFGRFLADFNLSFEFVLNGFQLSSMISLFVFFDVPGEGTLYTYLLKEDFNSYNPLRKL